MKWDRFKGAMGNLFRRKPEPPPAPKVKTIPFNPPMSRRVPGAFGNRLKNRRSQYDVRHLVPAPRGKLPNIPMWLHDYLVRQAMAAGVKRASHAVRNGWLPQIDEKQEAA